MQIDVKAREIAVLWKKELRWRITGVREKDVWIRRPPNPDQMFDKFNHAPHPKPAHPRARDFVPDQITEDSWMTAIRCHGRFNTRNDLVPGRSLAEELYMLGPRDCDQHPHPSCRTTIQKPKRRDVVDPDDV